MLQNTPEGWEVCMNEVRYNMHYPVTTEARHTQSNLQYAGLGDRNVCWWV